MVFASAIEGYQFRRRPVKIVSRVRFHSLEFAEHEPRPAHAHMATDDGRPNEGRQAEHENLDRVRITGRERRGRVEFVMHVVNMFICPRRVQPSVNPVVAVVFNDEEDGNLQKRLPELREGLGAVDARNFEKRT